MLIRDKEGIQERDLCQEIKKLLDMKKLPTQVAEDLDAVRQVGNFAAHPIKSVSTGQIYDVEVGEAEWTLSVLEELLRFYFVDDIQRQKRRDALNKKLQDAGKPTLQRPPS